MSGSNLCQANRVCSHVGFSECMRQVQRELSSTMRDELLIKEKKAHTLQL